MKTKVTEQGLVIPKEFLVGAEEAYISVEGNRVVIVPVPKVDPILDFGTNPVPCGAVSLMPPGTTTNIFTVLTLENTLSGYGIHHSVGNVIRPASQSRD